MLGVVGAPIEEVMALCRAGEVELAAVIVPGQLLIAREESAVAELAAAVAPVALKVKPLLVRRPLHTSLMGPAAEALERRDGHVRCVELGPCGTLERAVRFQGRDEAEIECFLTASAPVGRRTVRQW